MVKKIWKFYQFPPSRIGFFWYNSSNRSFMNNISSHIDYQNTEKLRPAAVLIPVFERDNELQLVFTKRSKSVQHHKGQICFPGGAKDQTDQNLWETALRESHEELGIDPRHVYYISELPKLSTPSLFEVTPFIGFLMNEPKFVPNPKEIERVITSPLEHFRDQNNLRFEEREYFGKIFPVPFFNYQDHEIWGATGRIMLSFLERWK